MDIKSNIKNYIIFIFTLVFFSTSFFIAREFEKPAIVVSKQESSFNINYQIIEFFHLGQKRLLSSIYWVATILESDHSHYKQRDLNSWMFLRFNTIAQLEPLFLETYTFGGPYLSIVKDDLTGATQIYKKGMHYYPNEFSLLKDAAFHFYFEVKDYDESYKIYQRLKNNPKASIHMISTLARLETEQGNLDDAFDLLFAKYNDLKDKKSFLATKIESSLYAIKAQRDLDCLNSIIEKKLCDKKDFRGLEYRKNSKGKYEAQFLWEKFKVKAKPQT